IGRLPHAVDRRVLEPQAMTVRGRRPAATLRGAFPLPHFEEITEVRVDSDVALEQSGAGTGVVDRPLIRDRRVDADAPLDQEPTEPIPQERADRQDIRGAQPKSAVPG